MYCKYCDEVFSMEQSVVISEYKKKKKFYFTKTLKREYSESPLERSNSLNFRLFFE